jgi:hypothetical protein
MNKMSDNFLLLPFFLLLLILFLLRLIFHLEKFSLPGVFRYGTNKTFTYFGRSPRTKQMSANHKTSGTNNITKTRTRPTFTPRTEFESSILGFMRSKPTCVLNSAVAMMLREGPTQSGSTYLQLRRAFRIETEEPAA